MNESLRTTLQNVGQQVISYLPSLLSGLLLAGLGLFLAWLAKRVAIQVFAIFHLDRLFRSFRWGQDLAKGDVRHAFFNLAGNIVYFTTLLIFLYAALDAMQLTFLSRFVQEGVTLVPRLLLALLIVGVGWWIAGSTANAVRRALIQEEIVRASLVSRFVRFVMVLFVVSMALVEMNLARDVVIIGFTASMVILGTLAIVTLWPHRRVLFHRDASEQDRPGPASGAGSG